MLRQMSQLNLFSSIIGLIGWAFFIILVTPLGNSIFPLFFTQDDWSGLTNGIYFGCFTVVAWLIALVGGFADLPRGRFPRSLAENPIRFGFWLGFSGLILVVLFLIMTFDY